MSPADQGMVRIGCGSGFAMDPVGPALDLARSGRVDYLCFDALAERTLAMAQVRRRADPRLGYDSRLAATGDALAPFVADGLKVVGNFGGANIDGAAEVIAERFRAVGMGGIRIASIAGDDVLSLVRELDLEIEELGSKRVSELGDRVVSANAYLGAAQIVEALGEGAQWCIGGRLCDPSLYVGPICHELGWDLDDWDRVAHATLVGHVLECSTHVTGGYFADPPFREVDGMRDLGFPFAEVKDGEAIITKLEGSGGMVDGRIVAAQVSYEVHDPAAYVNPDISADFTQVTTELVDHDRVRIAGARGQAPPDRYKALVGIDLGWKVVGEISYAAAGCLTRARLASEIVLDGIDELGPDVEDVRCDLHGIDALVGPSFRPENDDPAEVRLRIAARCATREVAEEISLQVERLYLEGPAGGGGVTRRVEPALGIFPVFIDASHVKPSITYLET